MSDWDAGGEPIPVQVTPPAGESDGQGADRLADRNGDEALSELVTELEATLRELRAEVDEDSRPNAGQRPRGERSPLPRPPSPRDLLRFTETYTIPTVVAFLEAAIRGLELLAATIRLLDGRDPRSPDRHGSDGNGVLADMSTAAGERAAASGREALARVDDALAELQQTYEGEPEDPTARRLLADARELRDDIDDRLAGMEPRGEDEQNGNDGDRDRGPTVDVDAELASLREQAGRGDESDDHSPDDDET